MAYTVNMIHNGLVVETYQFDSLRSALARADAAPSMFYVELLLNGKVIARL
jgi:hypothetical protein